MELETTQYNRVTVVDVEGRIDSTTAADFDQEIMGLVESGHKNLLVDMSGVEFLSSAGLRTLVSARKALQDSGGQIKLAQPSQRVIDTLDIAGLDVLFESISDREAAIASF